MIRGPEPTEVIFDDIDVASFHESSYDIEVPDGHARRGPGVQLRTVLRELAHAGPRLDADSMSFYRNPWDLVFRQGRMCTPQPFRDRAFRRGFPRRCYHNSLMIAAATGVPYIEGYAINHLSSGPVPHAWNLDERGLVVDSTWDDAVAPPRGRAYMGIRFSVRRAHDCTWHGDACVLDDWRRGHPLLREPWPGEMSFAADRDVLAKIVDDFIDHDKMDPLQAPGMVRQLGEGWTGPGLAPGLQRGARA